MGIGILVINLTYTISILENTIELSLKIPFKLTLLKLKIKEIMCVEETTIDAQAYPFKALKKTELKTDSYLIRNTNAIKITMLNKKIYIISCNKVHNIITLINSSIERENEIIRRI